MFDFCAMFVMLFALLVAIREWRILDEELSIHAEPVVVNPNRPYPIWYPAGCNYIHRASAHSGSIHYDTPRYAFVYGGVYFCIRAFVVLVRNNYSRRPGFCSRPQLNINIRGSNMRHRVVRVIDTAISVVFWSAVTVVVLYSGFSKRMCSKRNWFVSVCK